MHRFIFVLFLGLSTFIVRAQEEASIQFSNIAFAEALKQSAATGKLIFIDCYTSWCMPCKWMDKNVFTNDTVGTFFNSSFINLKMDMEKGEGVQLKEKYQVASFPTFLFINERGDIVHRTASRMEVSEFLQEGKNAKDPSASFAALKRRYESGERTNEVLFSYALALNKIDRNAAQKVEGELLSIITDEELNSAFGWQVIDKLARNENDRLGKYFLQNKDQYEKIAGAEAVNTVSNRLSMSTMYGLIREKNNTEFFKRLEQMRKNSDKEIQRNVAVLEMEYYYETNNPEAFVRVSNDAMKGILEYNDADLSFIARRVSRQENTDKAFLQQALLMARRAVALNPEEYSNQGTLANVCLALGLKEEGLAAAKKARQLADAYTSKIQKIAQELVDKLEKL